MKQMSIKCPEIGVCGLSCRLCPMFQTQSASRCAGCKSPARVAVGCPFITCAVKKKGIEFCWQCKENGDCIKWRKHRETGKQRDSFKCYQTLESDIEFIQRNGVDEFEKNQKIRETLLRKMLQEFNDGRSKSYFCIAATVLGIDELENALRKAQSQSKGLQPKDKTPLLKSILNSIAKERGNALILRKN